MAASRSSIVDTSNRIPAAELLIGAIAAACARA
jgi:hypothetical protein